MTDRELLEAAARAAGYAVTPDRFDDELLCLGEAYWNPLQDDGDALRLAVRLCFTVAVRPHEVEVFSDDTGECLESVPIFRGLPFVTEATDPREAARRAIVRAAAALATSAACPPAPPA